MKLMLTKSVFVSLINVPINFLMFITNKAEMRSSNKIYENIDKSTYANFNLHLLTYKGDEIINQENEKEQTT